MREYYDAYWSQENPSAARDPDSRRRRQILWSLALNADTAPGRLVECGSGDGSLVAEAQKSGFTAAGMEVSGVAIELARKNYGGCKFFQHSAEDRPWPIERDSCDVVVSFEVIEHLMRPRQLLLGAHDALKPGGFLALTTPYHGRLKDLALALRGFDRHFNVEGEHIRFFTDASLARLLRETGFDDFRLIHFGRVRWLWKGVFVWARKPLSARRGSQNLSASRLKTGWGSKIERGRRQA